MVMFDNRLRMLDNLRIVAIEDKKGEWKIKWMSWDDVPDGLVRTEDEFCNVTMRKCGSRAQAEEFARAVAQYEKSELDIVSYAWKEIIKEDYTEKP